MDRARKHIEELNALGEGFIEKCFGIPSEELDPETSDRLLNYCIVTPSTEEFSLPASDAINNLRHSLDQAINCANVELGARKRDAFFPVGPTVQKFLEVTVNNCRSVHPGLIDFIKGYQPYGGGDDALYGLAKLAGPNKHQLIVDVDANLVSMYMSGDWLNKIFAAPGSKLGFCGWDGEKKKLTVARLKPGSHYQVDYMTQVPIFVSLTGCEAARGQAAATFLNDQARKISAIIDGLEAETARLKALGPIGQAAPSP